MDSFIGGVVCVLIFLVGIVPLGLVLALVSQGAHLRRLQGRVANLEADLLAVQQQLAGRRGSPTADVALAASKPAPAKVPEKAVPTPAPAAGIETSIPAPAPTESPVETLPPVPVAEAAAPVAIPAAAPAES
ncbi:MAG TPA: hypothetical protein PLA94_04150, partial [Myxococcota bacterium]|nr:hypothetical protein [Myxococcota bacterium]